MKMIFKVAHPAALSVVVGALLLAAQPASAQPAVELPPDEGTPIPPVADTDDGDPLTRGLQQARFARAVKTSIGGYAELHYSLTMPDGGDTEGEVDFHRLVLFVAHNFTDRMRFYSELEVEHALVGGDEPGEVGVEQAYVEWDLVDPKIASLRAGIVLVPMGIVNQWHEPPIFNGVERPMVDKVIIPSTWREAAVGVVGEPIEGLRYEAYVMSGLDPLGFSAGSGIRGGRQKVAEARSTGLAFAGRVELEPMLSTVIGASGYAGLAGPNADIFDAMGNEVDPNVPVVGGAIDARTRWNGLEARGELASWQIGDTGDLRTAVDADGDAIGTDVGSTIMGGYAEVGYNLFRFLPEMTQQLVGFFRFERYDTLFKVTDRARNDATDDPRGAADYVVGVTYRPIPQVVFKGDFILRNPDGPDNHSKILSLGVGTMF
jgi:hypothetical protein